MKNCGAPSRSRPRPSAPRPLRCTVSAKQAGFHGQPEKTAKIERPGQFDKGRNRQQFALPGPDFGAHVKIGRFFR